MIIFTPTEESARLRIKDNAHDPQRIKGVLTRWLERMARRKNRHINEPSLIWDTERDASLRQTFLFAYADSFPDTLPDYLRTARINTGREVTIETAS